MSKITSLVILLVTIITLSILFSIFQARQPPRWQITLENYLKYKNDLLFKDPMLSGTLTVEQIVSASQPEEFQTLEDKRLVYGDYYWELENWEALSFPPQAVKCVLVRQETRPDKDALSKISYDVLYVTYYSDEGEPQWLIYQGPPASAIGCDMEYPPVQ